MHRHIIMACLAVGLAGCGGSLKSDGDAPDDVVGDTPADTQADQPPDTPTDSGEDPAPDTADVDAESDPTPECGSDGVLLWSICWYLGAPGQDCYGVCASHGGTADDAPRHVGVESQGGSLADCEEIFTALGYTGTVSEGYRDDGLGLGCHRWSDGVLWWLNTPAFDPGHSADNAQVACGCIE